MAVIAINDPYNDPYREERRRTLEAIREAVKKNAPSVMLSFDKRWVEPHLVRLTPLNLYAPPFITEAMGYQGAGRLFSLHLGSGGGEAILSDGVASIVADWVVYLTWTQHPTLAEALKEYDLGSVERPELHRLVIDRVTGRLYVGWVDDVEKALHAQFAAIELEAFAQAARRLWDMLFSGAMSLVAETKDGETLVKGLFASSEWADQAQEWLDANAGGKLSRQGVNDSTPCLYNL